VSESDDEDLALRSVAMQNAQSILFARQRAEQELLQAKKTLELRTQELARSLLVMRATLDSTWDGILVTGDDGSIIEHNEVYATMWRIPPEKVALKEHRSLLEFTSIQSCDPARFVQRVDGIYATSLPESFDVLELSDGRVFERFSKRLFVDETPVGRVWSFRDITLRRKAEEALRDETRMLELLNQTGITIAAKLDLEVLVQGITDAATQLSGAAFGAFFYNTTDERGDAFFLYTLSGAPRDAFARFGQPRATALFGPTFKGEAPIRCDDVLSDPRYGKSGPHYGMPRGHPPVRSYLAVPVVSRTNEVIGSLFCGHPEPRIFSERTERFVVGLAAQAAVPGRRR